ncbi:Uncharacterised protein [Mycobacterium tuberculosis]|uniref:Uncharacterized protein n=1 Tax=Mycobacterium tuberculosis TaxID=1773 RepID=A0A0U0SBW3_MYCTX|nr:Uncharacterised protein [Mycobacterium tuberculosis]COZ26751.1 Uncharacterised protein [Mycobacterium tuberculosis]
MRSLNSTPGTGKSATSRVSDATTSATDMAELRRDSPSANTRPSSTQRCRRRFPRAFKESPVAITFNT